MILQIYSKLTKEQEVNDAIKLANYMTGTMNVQQPESLENTAQISKTAWTVFEPFLYVKMCENRFKTEDAG